MEAELFSVRYTDKHTAALVFQTIKKSYKELGIISVGLERYKSLSVKSNYLKIIIAVDSSTSATIQGILSSIKESLRDHALFSVLSFDYNVIPLTKVCWNFQSYDDPNFQKIFIRKRTEKD